MNSIDHDSGAQRDAADISVQQAEPYRTPKNVPDETTRRGLLGSPIAWALATGAVLGAVGLVLARRSTNKDVINYVEDFGLNRRGPVEFDEEETVESVDAEYQSATQAASPEFVVEP